MSDETPEGASGTSGDRPEEAGDEVTGDAVEALVERVEAALERLGDEETDSAEAVEQLDELVDVADEAEDLLSTVDVEELVELVEWENLPEAVDVDDVPEAIDQRDPTEAIALRKLVSLSDLPELWDSVDSRELWREKRQLEEEIDDVTGEDGDDSSIVDVGDGSGLDVDADAGDVTMPDVGSGEVDPESVEKAVQSKVSRAVGEFRGKLIEAHDRLEEMREENQRRFDERRTQSSSRNPTAGVSTMPSRRGGGAVTVKHSTVPRETKYSTAPNRKRIYGDRFESAGGGDDG